MIYQIAWFGGMASVSLDGERFVSKLKDLINMRGLIAQNL